jgi:hypothetical protein
MIKMKADLTENLQTKTEEMRAEMTEKSNPEKKHTEMEIKSEQCRRNASFCGLVNYWPVKSGVMADLV